MHFKLIPRLIYKSEYFSLINGIHNNIYIGIAGKQDAYSIRVCFADRLKKFYASHVWHALVGDNDVNRIFFEQEDAFSSRSSSQYIIIPSETGFKCIEIPALIIYIQYLDSFFIW